MNQDRSTPAVLARACHAFSCRRQSHWSASGGTLRASRDA